MEIHPLFYSISFAFLTLIQLTITVLPYWFFIRSAIAGLFIVGSKHQPCLYYHGAGEQ